MEPTLNKVPEHIGIILDGNRRFAKRLMMKPWKGHEWGFKKVEKLVEWCQEFYIRELTLYCLSVQNFNRPKHEFNYLMDTFREGFKKSFEDPRIDKFKIKINVIGRTWMFPRDIQEMMSKIMEKTEKNNNYTINLAMAYGGREEVIDAVKKIAEEIKTGKIDIEQINEETFSRNLYLDSCPDLIIRTGGEKRTSNFLAWQSVYSEFIFIEKMWPEFEKKDLVKCLNEYSKRQRRFGC
ncbi:di-trans,poly-cis-decaprenylcistransferase [Candidatus Woesearchaeota archaeon]|nr:di-trans,poly-cis-decaprenylcistransferase [Candidatus Woesearchaeota archaeon]